MFSNCSSNINDDFAVNSHIVVALFANGLREKKKKDNVKRGSVFGK